MPELDEEQDLKQFIEDCAIIEERFKTLPDEVKSTLAKTLLDGINQEFLPILKRVKAEIMIDLGMI